MYSGLTLLTNPVTPLISVGGGELADSRRFADLLDIEAARVQFKSSAVISARIEYSLDQGLSWHVLIPEDAYLGSNPYISGWWVIPEEARVNDVLLRVWGVGSGVLVTVAYVEMSFR